MALFSKGAQQNSADELHWRHNYSVWSSRGGGLCTGECQSKLGTPIASDCGERKRPVALRTKLAGTNSSGAE